jgi:hypothetical protein
LNYNHSLKQIIAFRECPRAWAAKFLFRCDDPKNPYAQDGIDAHASAESWLRRKSFDFERRNRSPEGVWSTEVVRVGPESHTGKLAAAAVAFAPPGALPELDQNFTLFGRSVACHIDCLWPDWSEFADWKFTGGSRDLTQDQLPQDMQANFQSNGILKGSGRQDIKGLWVYVNTKTYRPVPVRGTFSLAQTEAYLQREALPVMQLIELFADLHAQGKLSSVQQLPHDITACTRRNGKIYCNFLGHCQMRASTGVSLAQLRAHQKKGTQ